jgi:hypothetical protein
VVSSNSGGEIVGVEGSEEAGCGRAVEGQGGGEGQV